ncbi:tRNA wybutosine-synthesizing protein 3 homolog isoform X1 [Carcharodon carcharias]|uniref:tRNA wybutosine-synthesizing protein 3 homolog isoform X1 n=1 Tax=Carcharodon carcharias TaxID=13397 RepID=UPI001B7E3D06|nr:tRNA wybutosine-synthesizing protein 3 homolog isoform X1 [Carcharodon carcharias]
MEPFRMRKEQRLRPGTDRSRAGRVDPAISRLVDRLNLSERYCSTSSCSGRILLLGGSDQTEVQKQNCSWLFVTHQKCQKEDVIAGLQKAQDNAVFKFEPFILHVQCRKLEDAQLLHSVAINSGFRNSGITVGKKGKIMMAVRSTHCLEVPLCHQGIVLVSEEYIDYLVQVANQKMEENQKRIERFYTGLQSALSAPVPPERLDENVSTADSSYTRRRRQRTTKKERGNGELTAHSDSESDLAFLMGST